MKDSKADCPTLKRPKFERWLQSDPFIFKSTAAANRFHPSSRHIPPSKSHHHTRLLGSLVRKEGHIYSLAVAGDLLYTGSEGNTIRVWKNHKEFARFKSSSGLIKAIVIAGDRIFSGHRDGKIRIWKPSDKDPTFHKRVGAMPTLKAKIKTSFHRKIRHTDAVSCLALSEDKSLLYSASWDKTFKVWRLSDSRCLESVAAHDDAVNSIVAGGGGCVFTGSADGTVKVWRRQAIVQGKKTKHVLSQTLLNQGSAVTALAVGGASAKYLYSGSSDGRVNFWECGEFVVGSGGVLRGHKLAVLCMAAAGELVLTGSADTKICVWRREGGDHVFVSMLTGHSGPVKCLAVVEEEETEGEGVQGCGGRQYTVYSGSIDKSVKIWKMTESPRRPES